MPAVASRPLIADRALVVCPIRYALCVSRKQYRATLKHFGLLDAADPAAWVNDGKGASTHHFDNRVSIVCVADWKGREMSQIAGLLVHEAVHIWQEVRATLGEDRPSMEFEAYAIQGIAQELIEMFEQAMGWC